MFHVKHRTFNRRGNGNEGTRYPPLSAVTRVDPVIMESAMVLPDAKPEPERAVIVAVANQKGGVGKTTSAINLGTALALQRRRVLLVDIDPQGNASAGLGVPAFEIRKSIYDVVVGDLQLSEVLEATAIDGLWLAPASIDLAGAELELVAVLSRELRLARALEALVRDFDIILIDCPPSLGLLTINALAAADEVLIPVQCEYYALEGLGQLIQNIELIRKGVNRRLHIGGVLLTMFDGRTRLSSDVASQVRDHFGELAYRTVVPRSVRLSEAPSYGEPIETFDRMSPGAVAYRYAAKEFLRRHRR